MPGLHLTRTTDNGEAIDALAGALRSDGGGRVGVTGMVRDLPGRLRRTFAPSPRLLGLKVSQAYTWEGPDRRDRGWWPQGITTSVGTGFREAHGHDVLMTSWYSRQGQGSRVSLADLHHRRYGHVLLVTPKVVDGEPRLEPLKVHAGGIVWHGDYLHVAATGKGFSSCHLGDVLRVPAGSPYETFEHRYVLPVRFAHKGVADEGVGRLRFSFFSVDHSGSEPTLLVGEYGSSKQSRRIARFAIDPATSLPRPDGDGRVLPELDHRGALRMQGIAAVDGTYYMTRSRTPYLPGSVYVGRPGAFREHWAATPFGPEDLVWWPETDSFWSVSEHPLRRWIFAMPRSELSPPA